MASNKTWHSKTVPLFRYSNLRLKFVVKSDSSDFGPSYSFASDNGNVYDTYNYSSYLIFGYESYDPEKKRQVKGSEIAFSCTTIVDLCEAFKNFMIVMRDNEVFGEVEDSDHGYECFVNEEFKSIKEKVSNEEGKAIMISFAVSEDPKTGEVQQGVNIFIGSKEELVFLPLRIIRAVEYKLRKLDFDSLMMLTAALPGRRRKGSSSSRKVTEEE
jgi:hypothetical protein